MRTVPEYFDSGSGLNCMRLPFSFLGKAAGKFTSSLSISMTNLFQPDARGDLVLLYEELSWELKYDESKSSV